MEDIIHQRDCSYGSDLYQHPLLSHLYPHSDSWPMDCQLRVKTMPQYRDHPETMIEQLRKVVRCGDRAEPEVEGFKDLESDEKEASVRAGRWGDPVEPEKESLKGIVESEKFRPDVALDGVASRKTHFNVVVDLSKPPCTRVFVEQLAVFGNKHYAEVMGPSVARVYSTMPQDWTTDGGQGKAKHRASTESHTSQLS
eukprot:scaffold8959_cov109-Cylindrotheca_fusiformis.AAC.3